MIIAGAGGHAKEVFDILVQKNPDEVLFFYDDIDLGKDIFCEKYMIFHSVDEITSTFPVNFEFCVAVGSPSARSLIFDKLRLNGGNVVSAVASTAVISLTDTSIGNGINVMHQCFISAAVSIGTCCLLNRSCGIHHDCKIGDFCEIGPGAILLGNVTLGNKVSVGAGSIVLAGLDVGDGAVIGAGSVVTKNILPGKTVVGVPARNINPS